MATDINQSFDLKRVRILSILVSDNLKTMEQGILSLVPSSEAHQRWKAWKIPNLIDLPMYKAKSISCVVNRSMIEMMNDKLLRLWLSGMAFLSWNGTKERLSLLLPSKMMAHHRIVYAGQWFLSPPKILVTRSSTAPCCQLANNG
ncbi:hypothetical protein Fot_24317 [Forsythia ovata]|uniref:ATP-dependent DNA helicase n=1 Tax=Forsythia ovata TaxID=205694 RepID=A0ABD1U5U9_9LAMI